MKKMFSFAEVIMMNALSVRSSVQSFPRFSTARRWTIPLWLFGALLLFALQLLSGTGPVYALLVFTLLVVSYYAVTWAGGLESLFGIAIFYLLLQHVLISQIAKVFFWESADAPLLRPIETMGVYVVGMTSLALGVLLANRCRRQKKPLFVAETKPSRLLWTSIFCTIFFTLLQLATRTIGTDAQTGGGLQGGVLGPLKQLGFLGPLAIASGTAYMIKSSNSHRSIGLVNGIPIIILFATAILSATREGTVAPVIIYGLTCIAFHYRFRVKHFASLLIIAYVANFIVFPYALIARGITRTGVFEENVRLSTNMMLDIVANPFVYRDRLSRQDAKRSRLMRRFDYYDHPSPTLGRYTLLAVTDGLVDATFSLGTTGMQTITPGFEAALPRFLNPDKPFVQTGNDLAHRVPGLSPAKNDHTTGITTGFFADAFTSYAWLGISAIPCLIIFCAMVAYRFLINDRIWNNVLMLSLVMSISLLGFSEEAIADLILLCTVGALATGVGMAALTVLVFALDRAADRLRYAWIANQHPHAQALQRILTVSLHRNSLPGID